MSRPTELSSGHSLVDYSSISDYFIHNILQADNADFDFSLDQILYLCDIEPHDCGALIGTLETVLDKSTISNGGDFLMEDESGDDQNSAQHPEHLPLEKNSLVIITDLPGVGSAAGFPKYIFLLGFLPFFPVIVLFAGASALALVATISTEFVISLLLPDRREVTFGKLWVGLTFLFFAPILYFTVRIFYDLIASVLL